MQGIIDEFILLMRKRPIQAAAQAVLLSHCKLNSQQLVHGAEVEPLPV
jgi:hypothetical protein